MKFTRIVAIVIVGIVIFGVVSCARDTEDTLVELEPNTNRVFHVYLLKNDGNTYYSQLEFDGIHTVESIQKASFNTPSLGYVNVYFSTGDVTNTQIQHEGQIITLDPVLSFIVEDTIQRSLPISVNSYLLVLQIPIPESELDETLNHLIDFTVDSL